LRETFFGDRTKVCQELYGGNRDLYDRFWMNDARDVSELLELQPEALLSPQVLRVIDALDDLLAHNGLPTVSVPLFEEGRPVGPGAKRESSE
jgi:hypothetical protein